ncbi:hypothetical protein RG963_07755 [Methanosarcina sp. Z-7115]|uniref:Mobile element protein n=1 Tax=Methanosarcina baikalica TaxID=3073890 RepID=A0ABU2D113_9EURY|nr:hypothetical protein [Methanosarcina sp. Z-7115]MDR7665668.1 hypothetical protein [Methanosarcina sp. Z-7115]
MEEQLKRQEIFLTANPIRLKGYLRKYTGTGNRGNYKSRNKFLYFFNSEILREIQK